MFDHMNKKYQKEQEVLEENLFINEAATETVLPSDDAVLSEADELTTVDPDSVPSKAINKVMKAIDSAPDDDVYETLETLVDDSDLEEEG